MEYRRRPTGFSMNKKTVFQKDFNIAWGDMDALGHVNNARYFDYFQQARIEWLANIGFGLREKTGPVVINVNCTYLKPVIYPAKLTLKCSIATPGNSSFWMHYDLYQNDVLMTESNCKIVWIDYKKNKSIPLPPEILELF